MNFSKRKILAVTETGHLSKRAVAGGDRLMQGMAPYLKKRYELEIIIPRSSKHHWKETKGIRFHLLRSNFFENSNNPLLVFLTYVLRIVQTTSYFMRKKGSFIAYSSTNLFVDVIPIFIVRFFRKDLRWIARVHHLTQHPLDRPGNILVNSLSFLIDRLTLLCIRHTDAVIVLNPVLQKKLQKNGFAKKSLYVLGGGINLSIIKKYIPKKSAPSFDGVYVGRIHRTKGVLDLPFIWKEVVNRIPHARLAIIGELSEKSTTSQLKKLIDRVGLPNNIMLTGFIPAKDLFSILKKAKVFLFTDHEAGFGLAVAEAMACGIPVIGFDIGVLGTIYKMGFKKVPLGNHKRFSKEIINLLLNAKLRQQLADEAKTEAAKFDWKLTSEKFTRILNRKN